MAKASYCFCHFCIFGFLITSGSLRSLSIHRNLPAIRVNRRKIEQVMQYTRSKQVVTEFIAKNWKLIAAIAGLGVVREAILRWKSIDLQGKVVLITGGSRGLGLAMAEEFAQQGTKLVICSREEDELVRASRHLSEFEAELLAVPCDVTHPEQVQRLVEQAIARFGRIDVVVNNAGVISVGPWQTLTRTDFEEAMNSMFWGTYNT